MAQADFLNRIQQDSRNKHQLKHEEQVTKENFRKRLENFFQDTLSKRHPGLDPHCVRLKCYGSLNNGFGLAGCDMDLLLALPDALLPKMLVKPSEAGTQPGPVIDARKPAEQNDDMSTTEDNAEATPQENFAIGWLLEGALLDAGLGARLLTKTRVPILKVCERPSDELLRNLRQYRLDQLKPKTPPEPLVPVSNSALPPLVGMEALESALKDLEDQDTAAGFPLPEPPSQQPAASLEFEGDYGIKCDVNFSNSVAVHNTRLLREYCLNDARVAQVGVFIKTWAKTRDINTPYWGTLSSYGYVLMVLHYLMNVVHPPVIPNLQHLAHNEDAWNPDTSIDLFEGKYDIRFLSDKRKIEDYRKIMGQNRDSTGNLIRGFFWYYSAREGFNWKNDIISIRTQGGILKKFAKGWTEAKWSEHTSKKNVRLRYLMAIEDPFETDHNVARVVGHNGIVAIRDEFRRAWDIITQVGTGVPMEDLMEPVEGRGDLLRKDQDHRKEKMKKMREALEAKERTLREAVAEKNGTSSDNDFPSSPLRPVSGNRQSLDPKLTRVSTFRDKPRQYGRRVRKIDDKSGSEDEDDQQVNAKVNDSKLNNVRTAPSDTVARLGGLQDEDPEHFCSTEDFSFSMGSDAWGNPVAWDLGTQDGRWLQWRDNKIRQGTWLGVTRPDLAALDQACPHDARRPKGEPSVNDVFPPFPLTKNEGETSCTLSFNIKRHLEKSKRRRKAQKPRRRKADGPAASKDDPAKDHSASPNLSHSAPTRSDRTSPRTPFTENPHSVVPDSPGPDPALPVSPRPLAADPMPSILVPSSLVPPNAAPAKLEECNQELRAGWKSRPLSDTTTELQNRSLEVTVPGTGPPQVKNQIYAVITELKGIPRKLQSASPSLSSTNPYSHTPAEFSNVVETTLSQPASQPIQDCPQDIDEKMPSAAFIRSRRLAFFAQRQHEEISHADYDPSVDEQTVKTLMREAGIEVRPQFTKKDSELGNWATSGWEAEGHARDIRRQGLQQSTTMTKVQGDHSFDSSQEIISDSNYGNHSSETTKDEIGASSEEEARASGKVPSTRYPNTPVEERPRDEDPRIMPIPRIYGFKFDVRQLRDLAVIKEGGNGCARDG